MTRHNFCLIVLKILFSGSIINTNHVSNLMIPIVGLIDFIFYTMSLYLSMHMINESQSQIILRQLFKPMNENIDILIQIQTDLYDLIKDIVQNNSTEQVLIQNTLNKLTTLEFVHQDTITMIKKNIDTISQISLSSKELRFFICTFSFLIFIYQIILWYLQYLSLKNSKTNQFYSFILCIIILSQSFAFLYFLQITSIVDSRYSPLFIYVCVLFFRSCINIYYYTCQDSSFLIE